MQDPLDSTESDEAKVPDLACSEDDFGVPDQEVSSAGLASDFTFSQPRPETQNIFVNQKENLNQISNVKAASTFTERMLSDDNLGRPTKRRVTAERDSIDVLLALPPPQQRPFRHRSMSSPIASTSNGRKVSKSKPTTFPSADFKSAILTSIPFPSSSNSNSSQSRNAKSGVAKPFRVLFSYLRCELNFDNDSTDDDEYGAFMKSERIANFLAVPLELEKVWCPVWMLEVSLTNWTSICS